VKLTHNDVWNWGFTLMMEHKFTVIINAEKH